MAKKPEQLSNAEYLALIEAQKAAQLKAREEQYRQQMAAKITSQVEQFAKEEAERQRPKNYQDLLDYAKQSLTSNKYVQFPKGVQISPFETLAPYYGDAAKTELAAAAEYAKQLNQQEAPRAIVSPNYYEQIKEKIPVAERGYSGRYLPKENLIEIASPKNKAAFQSALSEKDLAINKYGTIEQNLKSLQNTEGKTQLYRDTLEHEASHTLDKYIEYPFFDSSKYLGSPENLGYMGRIDHLAVGLSKVQREHYAMTGKRFETPDEYKSFILNLAASENPEEAISQFTEEAKRTLRSQILNAKYMPEILPKIQEYESLPWYKRMFQDIPKTKGSINRFEQSAQLIPALVEYRKASMPTA
jgi:hypothetical protein